MVFSFVFFLNKFLPALAHKNVNQKIQLVKKNLIHIKNIIKRKTKQHNILPNKEYKNLFFKELYLNL